MHDSVKHGPLRIKIGMWSKFGSGNLKRQVCY